MKAIPHKLFKLFFGFLLILTFGCSVNQDKDKLTDKDLKTEEMDTTHYILIRDNLYYDKSGNLCLKVIDRSFAEGGTAAENEKCIEYGWLNVVYCDTCKLMFTEENADQGVNKQPDGMTELRNVIDTATFRLVEIDPKVNVTIYQDKNYSYYHHEMLDGGTISLGEKTK